MKRYLFALLTLACSAAGGYAQTPPAQQTPPPQVTAIRAGRLIDTETGRESRNQIILVEGRKIKAVGANVEIPAGARVVDLSGSTVLPGLFDAHTHLCMTVDLQRDAGNYFYTTLNDPDSFRAVQGVANARAMLEAGFTTVRDVGNEGNYACVSVARAIERGMIQGPTMLTAGRIIAPFGGQFGLQPGRRELGEPEYFFADTRDEMRKAVRENAHFGAQVIKIVVDDQRYIYSADDIRYVIEEAKRAGLKVAAHCWTREGAHNAAEAGVASIEHANHISDEDLQLAKRNNVTLVFTPFPEWVLKLFRPNTEAASAEYRDEIDRLRAGHRAGVTIAFGTDAIDEIQKYTRGTQAMTWVDSYVAAGLAPRDILKAMTANAARLLGVERERGAIAPGMYADIIATPASPLENIDALKQVSFVMKYGAVVKEERK
ncbi:MAG TPA: amidohydrolase family protein [Pyrinomonadaceae bacterium]|nr:amidohydrolase family protein [Pyrinomonadaceae bacterium]